MTKPDLRGKMPESWRCIDCGINTAPGHLAREQMEQSLAWADEGVTPTYNELTEIYAVKAQIWKAAGMTPLGGCLCIGCLERRLGPAGNGTVAGAARASVNYAGGAVSGREPSPKPLS